MSRIKISYLHFFQLTIIIVFSMVFLRLVHIQLINHQKYKILGNNQQNHVSFYPANRGNIYTSDGFPLVRPKQTYELWFNNVGVTNHRDYAQSLSDIVEIAEDAVLRKIDSSSKNVMVAQNLDFEQYKAIKDLNMSNLFLNPVLKRYYPEGNMLSNTIGYIKKGDDNEVNGYFGIEQFYNGDLKGVNGSLTRKKTASGKTILQFGTQNVSAKDGSNIYLTIDRHIQKHVEKILKQKVAEHNALSGDVIIIEPKTGKILAIATYPSFDLINNDFSKYDNSLISEIYEPGSVIKPITMASALDLGVVDKNSTYEDNVNQSFSGHTIKNWDNENGGLLTMADILKYSNNQGTAHVSMKIGSVQLMKYFDKFGYGKKTEIDLIGEEPGLIYQDPSLRDIELVTAGFGQGIAMTPIQVAMSYTAFKNDGKIMRPYIVDKIVDNDQVYTNDPRIISKPISSKTVNTINDMLRQVVMEGEVGFVEEDRFAYSGKTGTAQIPLNGKYDPELTNTTFVGFFDNSDKVVIYARLEQPNEPSQYASETVYPMWLDIANFVGDYYDIPKAQVE